MAPLSCFLLVISVFFLDQKADFLIGLNDKQMVFFGLSGLCAFVVNITTYWIIKNTSVITYASFGKVKLCSSIIIGFLIFGGPLQLYQILGLVLTMIGVCAYTYLNLNTAKNVPLPK